MRTSLPLLWLCACENTEDWKLVFGDRQVPLADLVRQPAGRPADADFASQADDPLLDLQTAKQRATVLRGGRGHHFVVMRPYVPATPNGDEAAVQSTTLFTLAGNAGAPYLRRHGPREAVAATAPYADGLLALVCDPATGPLIYQWDASSSLFAGYGVPYTADPADSWTALGLCDAPARLGASSPGAFLVAVDGRVHRVTTSPFSVVEVGPAPAAVASMVWLDDLAGELEAVTLDGARFSWSDGVDEASATVDGEPVGDPVWRGVDGRLRLATTAGVWAWAPPAAPQLVAPTPAPGVDAPWAASGAALLAKETMPNDRAPELVVPVATAVATATDGGWVAAEVPVTPCAVDERCRDYGESEVIGVAGDVGRWVVLYDVWTWRRDEAHDTWATSSGVD